MGYVFILLVAFLIYFVFVHDAIRGIRSGSWPITQGTIESCSEHRLDEGTQSYCCVYIFRVDDARQGGVFAIHEKPRLLSEIQTALIGLPVTVSYNPVDCTDCRIEESQLLGYKISNSTN